MSDKEELASCVCSTHSNSDDFLAGCRAVFVFERSIETSEPPPRASTGEISSKWREKGSRVDEISDGTQDLLFGVHIPWSALFPGKQQIGRVEGHLEKDH